MMILAWVTWSIGILILLALALAVAAVVSTRTDQALHENDPRVCRGCGEAHPPFARFCRRCGRSLG